MMKVLLCVMGIFVLFTMPSSAGADDLVVGMQAGDWSFKDSKGNIHTRASWAGKVLLINYVDPDKSDLNEHLTDAMRKAKDDGQLKDETYKGIGIADCAATWKPNFAIRAIAGRKAKKYNTTILFDYKADLRKAWGLKKDTSNIIILDKDNVCRAIVRGKVDENKVDELVQLTIELQAKKSVTR